MTTTTTKKKNLFLIFKEIKKSFSFLSLTFLGLLTGRISGSRRPDLLWDLPTAAESTVEVTGTLKRLTGPSDRARRFAVDGPPFTA